MVERKTEVYTNRLNDEKIELKTVLTETFSNKEFFKHWENLTRHREQFKAQIANFQQNEGQFQIQLDAINEQIANLEKSAKEARARIK